MKFKGVKYPHNTITVAKIGDFKPSAQYVTSAAATECGKACGVATYACGMRV